MLSRDRGSGEGDFVDVEVSRQGCTGVFAVPVQDVDNSRGETGFFDEVGEVENTEGGLLGRFHDNGVPAREGGTELPRCHCEGVVPGDDLSAHTNGFAERVGEFVGVGVDDLTMDLVGITAVIAQTADDFGNVHIQGDTIWFAVIPCFDGREGLLVRFNQVAQFDEKVATVCGGHVAPFLGFEGFACGRNGDVHIFGSGSEDGGDFGFVPALVQQGGSQRYRVNGGALRRIDTCDLLSGLGLDKLVVDEETEGLFIFASIGSCKFNFEVGHFRYRAA